MELTTYEAEARLEADHWWFVTRRRLFAREIKRLGIRSDAHVLDVGTSTGTNLRLLRDEGFHQVEGLDFSADAIRFCAEKGLGQVRQGDIRSLPFDDHSFDLVLATDIVEHVDEDALAISEILRVTRPGGYVLFTVPAFQSLWGLQDDVSHHKRRYRRSHFNRLLQDAGFSVERSYYFNFFLFAPIWLARQLIRRTGASIKSENDLNNPVINGVLGAVFEIDCRLAPFLNVPFGVSIFSLARRPGGGE